jgi:hypothetical protein
MEERTGWTRCRQSPYAAPLEAARLTSGTPLSAAAFDVWLPGGLALCAARQLRMSYMPPPLPPPLPLPPAAA